MVTIRPSDEVRLYELMAAIDFTSEELAANKDRYLSKRQRQTLADCRGEWRFWSNIVRFFAPVLVVWAILDGIRIHDTVASRIGVVGFIVIVTAGYLIYLQNNWRKLNQDLAKGDVVSLGGPVRLRKYRTRSGMEYRLRIKETEFKISGQVYSAFQDGKPYTMYFTPHSRRIVSAEPLDDNPTQ